MASEKEFILRCIRYEFNHEKKKRKSVLQKVNIGSICSVLRDNILVSKSMCEFWFKTIRKKENG